MRTDMWLSNTSDAEKSIRLYVGFPGSERSPSPNYMHEWSLLSKCPRIYNLIKRCLHTLYIWNRAVCQWLWHANISQLWNTKQALKSDGDCFFTRTFSRRVWKDSNRRVKCEIKCSGLVIFMIIYGKRTFSMPETYSTHMKLYNLTVATFQT